MRTSDLKASRPFASDDDHPGTPVLPVVSETGLFEGGTAREVTGITQVGDLSGRLSSRSPTASIPGFSSTNPSADHGMVTGIESRAPNR